MLEDLKQKELEKELARVKTADGLLQETENILQQMRQLALWAENPAAGAEQRRLWDAEFQALKTRLDKLAALLPDFGKFDLSLLQEAPFGTSYVEAEDGRLQ